MTKIILPKMHGGLLYGQRVNVPEGAGKITHLCSDIDDESGYVNILLDSGDSIHCHYSLVDAKAKA